MQTNRQIKAGTLPLTAARFAPELMALLRQEAADRDRPLSYVLNEIVRQHYAAKGLAAPPKSRAAAD